jgi:hypothetical protein
MGHFLEMLYQIKEKGREIALLHRSFQSLLFVDQERKREGKQTTYLHRSFQSLLFVDQERNRERRSLRPAT